MGRLGPACSRTSSTTWFPTRLRWPSRWRTACRIGGADRARRGRSTSLQPGDHGTTFGGSPVPAAAALEHLAIRDVVDIDAQVTTAGQMLTDELAAIARDYSDVFEAPRGDRA